MRTRQAAVPLSSFLRGVAAGLAVAASLAACGGGASPAVAPPPPPPAPLFLPQSPAPAGLWAPAAGAVPAVGNYVYLSSEGGDSVGAGRSASYSRANAALDVAASGGRLNVAVDGDQAWRGVFQAMGNLGQPRAGYYGELKHYPQHDAARGGLDWSGDGRACAAASGWFVIDQLSYSNGALASLDLRFEQRCDGAAAALRGAIHWTAVDAAPAPANQPLPVPQGLWQAPAGAVPAGANYVYLQGQEGDYIVGARSYLYTAVDSVIDLTAKGSLLSLELGGAQSWRVRFQGMAGIGRLRQGYYGELSRYAEVATAGSSMNWGGEGRGCTSLGGWFVVDQARYAGEQLKSLDLRFEQRCEGIGALHGQIHWDADATAAPPGPVNPPPAGLWRAAAAELPAGGNYLLLRSDAGDLAGEGKNLLYGADNAKFNFLGKAEGKTLYLAVLDAKSNNQVLLGLLRTMAGVAPQAGYYADALAYSFSNPARAGMSWGRCSATTGWFAIDHIAYVGADLAALDLRFEQHCDGATAALRGQLHWAK